MSFVKDKMKKHGKKAEGDARAYAADVNLSELVKMGSPGPLSKMLTLDQKLKIITRLMEGLESQRKQWNMAEKKWEYEPDMSVRHKYLESALKHWLGLPPQFIAQVSGTFEELSDLLDAAKASPVTQEEMKLWGGVQKTGGEKVVEVTSEESA